ncbi:hypothetical protein EBU99_10675 [bacterium]|nr:hypothetical protein [bacterium]
MLKRSHFSADLWFIFGSFCYGAEAFLLNCQSETLLLRIKSPTPAALGEIAAFFDQVEDNVQKLMRSEIRVFVNCNPDESQPEQWADELIASVMTELKPKVRISAQGFDVEFSDIRGLTPTDGTAWSNLVTDVWPQLPS